jgi:hypothetical protein
LAYFGWYYSDPDNDKEGAFELQIDNNSNFNSPEVDRFFTIYGNINSGDFQQQLVDIKVTPTVSCTQFYPSTPAGCGDYINYNTKYYWRVRVRDQKGMWSVATGNGWFSYNDPSDADGDGNTHTYTFEYSHPAPSPGFTYSSSTTKPPVNVSFVDGLSTCYNDSGLVPCKDLINCIDGYCYTWNFADGSPVSHTKGPVSNTYTATGNYPVSLRICDDIYCCSTWNTVTVGANAGKSVPQWQEISPF